MGHLRLALRSLLRAPGFTAAAVLVLALGVGGSTAVFSLLHGVVLRRLAVPAPDQLVRIYERPAGIDAHWPFPGPDFFDLREESRSFAAMAGIRAEQQTLTGRGLPRAIRVARVTASFYDTLREWPASGRPPDPASDAGGGPLSAVVTDAFWRRELSADPAAIGRTLVLDGRSYTISGVMARGFNFPLLRDAEILLSAAFTPREREFRGSAWLTVVGRLKPGTGLPEARAEIAGLAPRIFARSEEHAGWHMEIAPLLEDLVGPVKPALTALLGAVLLILLIACANVASLLLARGMSRSRELAIRAALGAGRGSMVLHLASEAMLIAVVGGAVGLAFAPWALSGLLVLAPRDLPRLDQVHLDGSVLAFALAATMLAGILAGVAPALQLTRPQIMDVLKNGSAGSRKPSRARAALVTVEIALAFVLSAGAGLMARSLGALLDVPTGLSDPAEVLVADVDLPRAQYPDERIVTFARDLTQRLSALPDARGAALMTSIPLDPRGRAEYGFALEGADASAPGESPKAEILWATPGYLQTLGISLATGRDLSWADTKTAPHVILVNEAFVRRLIPNGSPIGRRVTELLGPGNDPWQIAGVVKDVRTKSLDRAPAPLIILPLLQNPMPGLRVAVRASSPDALALAGAVRRELSAIDKDVPLTLPRTLAQVTTQSLGGPRFQMSLFALFAAMALTLAAVGIYGVVMYSVAQRSREIGIRMALGADASQVRRMVFANGVRLALAGVVLGLLGAFAAGRAVASLVYGVGTSDPATLAVSAGVLLLAAALASWVPALRATGVDPAVSLRAE
ncbi:MAG TPA: ABC transporter permease [Myxococcales bacterium]|jgi:predicted permease